MPGVCDVLARPALPSQPTHITSLTPESAHLPNSIWRVISHGGWAIFLLSETSRNLALFHLGGKLTEMGAAVSHKHTHINMARATHTYTYSITTTSVF